MQRTTVYLPEDLKRALTSTATAQGRSEAEVIRDALRAAVSPSPPRPRLPLFDSGAGGLAEHVDEALGGFGEQ